MPRREGKRGKRKQGTRHISTFRIDGTAGLEIKGICEVLFEVYMTTQGGKRKKRNKEYLQIFANK